MRKVYHLGTCSTCQRIIRELDLTNFELQDIKTERITEDQLDEMAALAGSYEALFSRRAMKYKSMGLACRDLSEQDYRRLILEEYTFLKRPVAIFGDKIFAGNSAKTTAALKAALESGRAD
jgi:arsenate reductase